jgi:hypothetical protein
MRFGISMHPVDVMPLAVLPLHRLDHPNLFLSYTGPTLRRQYPTYTVTCHPPILLQPLQCKHLTHSNTHKIFTQLVNPTIDEISRSKGKLAPRNMQALPYCYICIILKCNILTHHANVVKRYQRCTCNVFKRQNIAIRAKNWRSKDCDLDLRKIFANLM